MAGIQERIDGLEKEQEEQECNTLFYTAHHNWAWIVALGLADLGAEAKAAIAASSSRKQEAQTKAEEGRTVTRCSRARDLPSQQQGRPAYALFRVESGSEAERGVWCTSTALEFLDAKDALYEHLPAEAMPDTLLLDWDCISDDGSIEKFLLTHDKVLLKAALGSGGSGLYFVDSCEAVLAVLKGHAARAQREDGFLDKLRLDNGGRVPRWSLQTLLTPVLVGGRKSQVRAYIVFIEDDDQPHCYFYSCFEVRLPNWEAEIATADYTTMDDYEREVCGGSDAVPYNRGRIKADTERLLLSECAELTGAQEAIEKTLTSAFRVLRSELTTRKGISNSAYVKVAVVGVDLLLEHCGGGAEDSSLVASILEVNNNPAMANPLKHRMSLLYKEHLGTFFHDLTELSMRNRIGGFKCIF